MTHDFSKMTRLAAAAVLAGGVAGLAGTSPATGETQDLATISIAALQDRFASGEVSAEAAVSAALARIERYDPYYNAFVSMNPDALDQARRIDALRARGEALGPLAGVPVVVKDSMDYAGLPTTGGWEGLSAEAGGHRSGPRKARAGGAAAG